MTSRYGYKRMRTTAEARAALASKQDGIIKVRAKRNYANLPTERDDKPIGRQPRADRYKNKR